MEPTASAPQPNSSENRSDRGAQHRNRIVRIWTLALGLVIITVLGVGHQFGWGKVVGVDALCPFGGLETLWALIVSATFLQRVAASSVILLATVVAIAVVFRRSFCGYICPFGALQELFARAGSLVWGNRRPQMPTMLDRPARYLKYVLLVGFVVWSWQAAELVLRPYDPWVAWMHLGAPDLKTVVAEFAVGFVVLGVSVVGSFVYDRFFCKYLCPMGALLAIVSKFSIFKIRRDTTTCTNCKACDKACPVNVSVSTVETVDSPECIDCSECVNVCPVKGTLTVTGPKNKSGQRVTLGTMAVLGSVLAIIGVALALTTATGTFAWTLPSLAAITPGGAATPSSFDVANIRGSMSFEEVSKATGIPGEVFRQKFGVTEAQMVKPMKEFAESKGFDVETDVRGFVAEQLGQTTAP